MGHLIGPNIAHWNDFCHIKNLKFPPSPIPIGSPKRSIEVQNWSDYILMGHLIGPSIAH